MGAGLREPRRLGFHRRLVKPEDPGRSPHVARAGKASAWWGDARPRTTKRTTRERPVDVARVRASKGPAWEPKRRSKASGANPSAKRRCAKQRSWIKRRKPSAREDFLTSSEAKARTR